MIGEKWHFMFFGRYPYALQWRPGVVCFLFIGLYLVSALRRFWRPSLILIWIATLTVTGDVTYTKFFDALYILTRIGFLGATTLEVDIE